MKRIGAAVFLLLIASGGRSAPPTATCVFSNPAFAGKCVETADLGQGSSPQQACEAILSCLNNSGCLKTYCQATEIRTGWRLESAK
jgi:hypothetical protein